MADTLPPGWLGNDAESHITLGAFRLTTYRPRRYNALARQHQRGEWVHMRVTFVPLDTETGKTDSTESRRAALTALLTLLDAARAEVVVAMAKLTPECGVCGGEHATTDHRYTYADLTRDDGDF